MDARDFCYWLQGFMEVSGIGTEDDLEGIHPDQAKIIRDHLKLVFQKETPVRQIGFKEAFEEQARKLQWGGGSAALTCSAQPLIYGDVPKWDGMSCSLSPPRRLIGFERTYC